jgi:flagellar basal-body rod protein FlgC
MDFFSALEISGSGLTAERERVNIASSNLANADSTRGPDGHAYRRKDPVLTAVSFADQLGQSATGVQVSQVVEDPTPGRRVYSPGHPDADPDGFVTFPNVNPIHEVVNLMSASNSYDANETAVETLKSMAQRALDI